MVTVTLSRIFVNNYISDLRQREEKINKLFTGFGEEHIVKNCDLGLETL